MQYRQAGFAVFWVGIAATLLWGALNRLDFALATLAIGFAATEQAFVAARVEETFPFAGKIKLSPLSASITASKGQHGFDSVEWKMDLKSWQQPFTLKVHSKSRARPTEATLRKIRATLANMPGLEEIDFAGNTATVIFLDDHRLKQAVPRALSALERLWR